MITAMGHRQLSFLIAAHGTYDGSAKLLSPLAGYKADAASGSMEKDCVTCLHLVSATQEILGSHTFEHHRRRFLIAYARRHLDHAVRTHEPRFSVRAHRWSRVSDAITNRKIRDPITHRFNHTSGFHTGCEWHLRRRVKTGAKVHVNVVKTDRRMTNKYFTWPWVTYVHLREL
jgi:hypothetical protein